MCEYESWVRRDRPGPRAVAGFWPPPHEPVVCHSPSLHKCRATCLCVLRQRRRRASIQRCPDRGLMDQAWLKSLRVSLSESTLPLSEITNLITATLPELGARILPIARQKFLSSIFLRCARE